MVDVTLLLKEELSVYIPLLPGMKDIVKVVGRLRTLVWYAVFGVVKHWHVHDLVSVPDLYLHGFL